MLRQLQKVFSITLRKSIQNIIIIRDFLQRNVSLSISERHLLFEVAHPIVNCKSGKFFECTFGFSITVLDMLLIQRLKQKCKQYLQLLKIHEVLILDPICFKNLFTCTRKRKAQKMTRLKSFQASGETNFICKYTPFSIFHLFYVGEVKR